MLPRSKICGPLHFNYLFHEEQKIGGMKDNSKSLQRRYKILNLLREKSLILTLKLLNSVSFFIWKTSFMNNYLEMRLVWDEVAFAIGSYSVQIIFFGGGGTGSGYYWWAFHFTCILILESLPSRTTVKLLRQTPFALCLGLCFSACRFKGRRHHRCSPTIAQKREERLWCVNLL